MMEKPTILIIGTLDTKAAEILFLRNQILSYGYCAVKILDVSRILQDTEALDIPMEETVPRILRIAHPAKDLPRGEYITAMISQCIPILDHLLNMSEIHGIISAGGSSGTSLATALMRRTCPVGFPKLMVSTMASGDIKHYVENTDITMMYSVVDIAGINSILEQILTNAAGAIVGMTTAYVKLLRDKKKKQEAGKSAKKYRIAVTMFGVTTPGVDKIRDLLASCSKAASQYEIFVFHATGSGGLAMERLILEGQIDAVIDLTTTEIADELFGGVLSAGPDRLDAGARCGIPMVVSVGACDMVNFGPKATVPGQYKDRKMTEHNPAVTLMRTSKEECQGIGNFIVDKLRKAARPDLIKVLLPTGGVSMISAPGQVFHDGEADGALFEVLESGLKDCGISVERHSSNVNDDVFAQAVVDAILGLMGGGSA